MKKIPWFAINIALTLITGIVAYKDQQNTIKEEVAKALAERK